ncbi:unnamed protein product [marine sediment metagenome]|uniref:Uncharacterized protein n=1 Tax=marine sediment metagenome TaxID=412755 RepID=X0UK85_9ZZZZ
MADDVYYPVTVSFLQDRDDVTKCGAAGALKVGLSGRKQYGIFKCYGDGAGRGVDNDLIIIAETCSGAGRLVALGYLSLELFDSLLTMGKFLGKDCFFSAGTFKG